MFRTVAIGACLILATSVAIAQTVAVSPLITVDVVVSDASGEPLAGLARDDFELLEDGQLLPIRSFEAHGRPPEPVPASESPLPTLKKRSPTTPPSNRPAPITALVFDLLNTTVDSQSETRKQVLRFLESLRPNQRVAVFTIRSGPSMLQRVTEDKASLIAAVEKMTPQDPALFKTILQRASEFDAILSVTDRNVRNELAQRILNEELTQTSRRVQITLDSLQQIARSLARYPGRKNLVWITSGIPTALASTDVIPASLLDDSSSAVLGSASYETQLSDASARLAASHIAVYPIAAPPGRGTVHQDARVTAPMAHAIRCLSAANRSAMHHLAIQTGAIDLPDTNDLASAITRGMVHGSTYYTLGYRSTDLDSHRAPRLLQVRTARKDLSVAYGHAAPKTAQGEETIAEIVKSAMQPNTPNSTELLLQASLCQGPDPSGKLRVEYYLDPTQLRTTQGEAPQLEMFVTSVTALAHRTKPVSHPLAAQAFLRRRGCVNADTVDVEPETTQLRIGVLERSTGRIGTADIFLFPDRMLQATTKQRRMPGAVSVW